MRLRLTEKNVLGDLWMLLLCLVHAPEWRQLGVWECSVLGDSWEGRVAGECHCLPQRDETKHFACVRYHRRGAKQACMYVVAGVGEGRILKSSVEEFLSCFILPNLACDGWSNELIFFKLKGSHVSVPEVRMPCEWSSEARTVGWMFHG